MFVYEALLEALLSGHTAIPCAEFEQRYHELHARDLHTGKSKLQEQFEVYMSMYL